MDKHSNGAIADSHLLRVDQEAGDCAHHHPGMAGSVAIAAYALDVADRLRRALS